MIRHKPPQSPEQMEARMHAEHSDVFEQRMNENLTRREVIAAIEAVAWEYGCNGNHDSDLICDAFRKLGKALL